MNISIIIVSWNVKRQLSACIDSIKEHPTKYSYEIIVVDNASEDGTIELLQEKYADVHVIVNRKNFGFGSANNQAALVAKGDYLFILNPDTVLLPNTIDDMVNFMQSNPDIAMSGPRVLNEDGSTQRSVRLFQSWEAAFSKYTPCKYFGIFKEDLNRWRCRNFDYSKQADVEQLIGAALLIRRSLFESLGGFDERFFMYYEEVDLCYRIHISGQRNVYYPGAALIHIGGSSSSQVPAKKQFMILESLAKYLKKHSSPLQARVLPPLFKSGVLLMMMCDMVFYLLAYHALCLAIQKKNKGKYQRRYKTAYEFIAKYFLPFVKS